ncbi:XRE family transcriptional regulator [Microbacterium thalassium]|uniref:Transcriptional regulator with XRE-family HTH domain n=1 Tax=Microbacterium thalassium TaxID=362649 RepID=A0A7X0KT86_9MICO|nr:XRE family transcriptional regulator [Microbacterium thalassium]MBB6389822.1 transcriptional regulator with XRE-family HTH domain [Microbacterium thalassium]GLK24510.1 putative DNA-binding protein [Microbacterium thalassium]
MAVSDVVGRNVKRYRHERGMSMAALGERAGLAKQTIASIESGQGNPTIDTVERLASSLGVSARALLTELGTEVLHSHAASAIWRRSGKVRERPLDQAFGSGYVTNALIRVDTNRGRAVYPARGRGALRHCYVLEGELRLGPTTSPAVAVVGDFVRFPADTEHFLEAITPVATLFACTTSPQLTMDEDGGWF